ncbi:hypothetical protein CspHIS471_0102390 [Cutaneotrichosporon sp. HIS471]|nr:hypothetical protein CspHIS471_0102390 [Cutaneotrichosporon sp. HIS471]
MSLSSGCGSVSHARTHIPPHHQAGSSRRVTTASVMSIDDISPWWEDERRRGPKALAMLRSWAEDPQKMGDEPVVLALADPSFEPSTRAAEGYNTLRQMLVRFDAHRDFDHRSDWEAAKTFFGVYGTVPTVPVLFWSHQRSFLTCAENLAMLGAYTRSQIVYETHALRGIMHANGMFVGHLSTRVGTTCFDTNESMGIGELPKYPKYASNLAFLGPQNEEVLYPPAAVALNPQPRSSAGAPNSSRSTIIGSSRWLVPASSSPVAAATRQLPAPLRVEQAARRSLSLWIPPSQFGLAPPTSSTAGPSSPSVFPSSPNQQPPPQASPHTVGVPFPALSSVDKPLPSMPSSDFEFPAPSQARPQSPVSSRHHHRRSVANETTAEVANIMSAYERNTCTHRHGRRRSITLGEPFSPRLDPYARPGSPLRSTGLSMNRGPASPTRAMPSHRRMRSVSRTVTSRDDVVDYADIPSFSLYAQAGLGQQYARTGPSSSAVTTPAASSSSPVNSSRPAPESHGPISSFAPAFPQVDPQRTPRARTARVPPRPVPQPIYPELPMQPLRPARQVQRPRSSSNLRQ